MLRARVGCSPDKSRLSATPPGSCSAAALNLVGNEASTVSFIVVGDEASTVSLIVVGDEASTVAFIVVGNEASAVSLIVVGDEASKARIPRRRNAFRIAYAGYILC